MSNINGKEEQELKSIKDNEREVQVIRKEEVTDETIIK